MKKTFKLFCLALLGAHSLSAQISFSDNIIDKGDGSYSISVHTVDLDQDGKNDVVVAQGTNKITWYKNFGNGYFDFQRVITNTAASAACVYAADLNGDGKQDVISASSGDNKIAWYENLGSGVFSAPKIITTTLSSARTVVADDIDGDGDMDIIAGGGGSSSGGVFCYINLGGGIFSAGYQISSLYNVQKIVLGDIDNNGFNDIMFSTTQNDDVKIFKNNGTGGFALHKTLSNTFDAKAILFTDANGDGYLDAIVAVPGNIKRFINTGGSMSSTGTVIVNSNNVYSMASVDLDQDGDQDIICGNALGTGVNALRWFKNPGNGSYTTTSVLTTMKDDINAMTIADFDLDGKPDIVSANYSDKRVVFFQRPVLSTDWEWTWKTISTNVQGLVRIDSKDIDGDGLPDIIATAAEGGVSTLRKDDNKIGWYKNLGGGTFSRLGMIINETNVNFPNYQAALSGDINGDGKNDIVLLYDSGRKISWFKNLGNGVFQFPAIYIGSSTSFNYSSVQLGDIDGDGDLDIVACQSNLGSEVKIIKFMNNAGMFDPATDIDGNYSAIGSGVKLQLVDINMDGRLDILSCHGSKNMVRWYRNTSNGNFAAAAVINNTIQDPVGITADDLDQDGDIDIGIVSMLENKMVWHRNNGNASFSAELLIDGTLSGPLGIYFGDIDGDTKADIVAINQNEIVFYKNNGGANFAARQHVVDVTQLGYGGCILTDLDNDGIKDILYMKNSDGKIAWIKACVNTVSTQNASFCAGGAYTLNGQTYSTPGTYTQVSTNSSGCTVTTTLNLTLKQPTTSTLTRTACGSYTLHGQTYTSSGTYTQVIPNTAGCDSTITLHLTIRQPTTSVISRTECGSVTINGETFSNSGTYTQTLTNVAGCDSIITLNLIIKQPTTLSITEKVCDAVSYTLNGQTYTSNGTYTQLLQNVVGCDSTITLNLTFVNSTTATVSDQGCGSYTLHGQTYTSSGTYTQVIPNMAGCDSTITLNLTIKQPTTSVISRTECGSVTINGETFSNSGTYTQTLTNMAGCDSILTLNLIIKQPTIFSITEKVCDAVSYTLNGQTYTSSGTYTQILQNAAGCDSIINLILIIDEIDNSVSVNGATLQANHTGASYQWVNCDTGNTPIPGANSSSFTPIANGNYAVKIFQNGCEKTSSCISVTTVGVQLINEEENLQISVYPNPANEYITVVTPETDMEITIFDETGRELIIQQANETTTTINVGSLAAGVYYIHVGNNFTEKLIKQ